MVAAPFILLKSYTKKDRSRFQKIILLQPFYSYTMLTCILTYIMHSFYHIYRSTPVHRYIR